ncbi:amino acid transporter [Curvularia clavata]|uniref:Amino acid transporter n=1 Tax=Curvularia clavata TaxID=95742 RepID=A0A9Q8ZJJ8_CURCL|nr:amino acid transporter [Curvularia clavata]
MSENTRSINLAHNESEYKGFQPSVAAEKPLAKLTPYSSQTHSARPGDEESCHEGYVSESMRHISMLDIASVGWSICNSWVGVIATLAFNISNGGSPGLLYGLWIVFVMYGCIVYTLAELSRVYPSAGGQYHWTAILAPKWCARVASYACGMINIFAWAALSAGVAIIVPQVLLAIVINYNPSYELQRWHVFLIYQASSKAVWVTFVDLSGWNNTGVVFLIGLLTPGYMYAGIDGAVHLAEEATNAREAVPRALLSTWIVGFVTSFVVAVACMYSAQDFTAVATSRTGFPIFELWRQATRSEAAATAFLVYVLVAGFMALAGCQQTASRLTWSFARDSGLIASSKICRIDGRWKAPIWALCANGFVIFLIGCIYLGSSTAFNAFIGTGLILQLITFAFPAVILLARGRPARFLPSTRTYGLPSAFGWIANFFTIAFALLCFIFYNMPAVRPVNAQNMMQIIH